MPVASLVKNILLRSAREIVVVVPFSLSTMLPCENVMVRPAAVNDCSTPSDCCTVRNWKSSALAVNTADTTNASIRKIFFIVLSFLS